MVWSILKDILIICFAGGIGVYFFKQINPFFRAHTLQIILALLTYCGARAITSYQQNHQIELNNQWLYNVYIILEGLLLYYAAYHYVRQTNLKRLVLGFTIVFVTVYITQLIRLGYDQFANFAFIVEGVFALVIYLVIMYRSVNTAQNSKKVRPEFWLSLGLALYFACNAPYFGFIHYLSELSPELNYKFFIFITDTLSHVRYLLAAVGLYLGARYYRQANAYE